MKLLLDCLKQVKNPRAQGGPPLTVYTVHAEQSDNAVNVTGNVEPIHEEDRKLITYRTMDVQH